MKVNLEIIPRAAFRPYLKRTARWACLVVHRRGGKTFCCVQDLLARAFTHKRPGPPLRYAYIAPTRDQAKDIAWSYLKRFTAKIPDVKVNEADLSITLPNMAGIRLYSGESYDRMRGLYFDGVIIDECADIDPSAWDEVIRPALSDYSGWATFIGTPKGKNSFYAKHKEAEANEDGNWYSLVLRASESGILDEEELADIRRNTPEPIYLQEFECDFAVALQGAIYAAHVAKLRAQGRITTVPHDAGLPVWTFWDLGSPRNTAVWSLQLTRNEIRILNCDAAKDWTTAQRVAEMQARGYAYAGHIIPHDGAALQKGGITYQEELERAGLRNVLTLPRTTDPNARIHRIIALMPSMWIDSTACALGIEALENYRTDWDKKKKMFADKPYHDWSSHPCDALGYLAEAIDGGVVKFGGSESRGKVISPLEGVGDVWPGKGRGRRTGVVISPLG